MVPPSGLTKRHLAADVADRAGRRTARRARAARPGSHSALASENATIVGARAAATAASCARILPPRGELEDDVGAGRARAASRRRVGRAVAGDDDLEAVARVVERQRVGDLRRDDRLLGVRGDDQRDARAAAASAPARRPRGRRRRSSSERERVADLRPGQQAGGDRENGRLLTSGSAWRTARGGCSATASQEKRGRAAAGAAAASAARRGGSSRSARERRRAARRRRRAATSSRGAERGDLREAADGAEQRAGGRGRARRSRTPDWSISR